jgi:CBS domain-containing protein
MAKNKAVFGIYRSRGEVEEAVDALKAAGYRNTDISVLLPDNQGTKDFAHEKHTKAPEGATIGAGSGALVGGTLGWLAGIGALAVPGVGPLIAAGPIVAALAGAGAGGALGGITGAIIGLGVPEYEAKRYEGRIRSGGILLSVHCDDNDWTRRAKDILERTGAEDISSAGEEKGDFARGDKPMPRGTSEPGYREEHERGGAHRERRGSFQPIRARKREYTAESRREFESSPYEGMRGMKVRELMSSDVEIVGADQPIRHAAERMRVIDIGVLPVQDGDEIVGIVTDRDIAVRASAEGYDPNATAVRAVMTEGVVSVYDDQEVIEAARLMEEHQIRRLPVLDRENRLYGMISLGDIAARAGDQKISGQILERVSEGG